MEEANKLFYFFLEKYAPHLSKKFKKNKNGLYETYPSIKNAGEKFIFNPNRKEIVRFYIKTIYTGFSYEKEIKDQIIKII